MVRVLKKCKAGWESDWEWFLYRVARALSEERTFVQRLE